MKLNRIFKISYPSIYERASVHIAAAAMPFTSIATFWHQILFSRHCFEFSFCSEDNEWNVANGFFRHRCSNQKYYPRIRFILSPLECQCSLLRISIFAIIALNKIRTNGE